jgi:fluoride exporter
MLSLVFVAAGGATGAIMRYVLVNTVNSFHKDVSHMGTLAVNLVGSFLIGFLWQVTNSTFSNVPNNIKLFIFTGILSSFTTLSAFSLDNFTLIQSGKYGYAVTNIVTTVLLGILLAAFGIFLAKAVR